MEIHLDRLIGKANITEDSMDIPDCFGEFDKNSRLCFDYCAISIKCCIMQFRHPKIDILEKLLIYNDYAAKPN
ncbi:hypothetical protein [Desulfobacter postgatei]|jgi:hypothetical protein|uniref:Uncharacterized protein n=1 Tax=Desulfobacter postgatei 2ac9 TaxID=879212 RepID=I5B2I9_9BACT|nr:hypothetical protein [Desulfobacter postgatei]EIM63702.1 hypothetical protein DespoDRAFT_01786 [Desulfobacter postgatei 2ac9]MDX9962208.1 hypothetical protein [Desulfobacter postgatei]